MNDGYMVLAMCILSPKYLIPERAFVHYYQGIPLTGKIKVMTWLDDDLLKEMQKMVKIKKSVRKAAEIYGIDAPQFCRMVKGLDNNYRPFWFLNINRGKERNKKTI